MKCLCGYNQKPDNVKILRAHLEDCLTTGALKDMHPAPVVIWRNGLRVVEKLEEGEVALELGITIQRAPSSQKKIEQKLIQAETSKMLLVQEKEEEGASPKEIVEAIEELESSPAGEEVVEKKNPAPRKKAAPKKSSSKSNSKKL